MGVWQYYKRCIILYLYNCQSKKAFICAYFYLFTLYITLEYQNIFIDNFVT